MKTLRGLTAGPCLPFLRNEGCSALPPLMIQAGLVGAPVRRVGFRADGSGPPGAGFVPAVPLGSLVVSGQGRWPACPVGSTRHLPFKRFDPVVLAPGLGGGSLPAAALPWL